MIPPTWHRSGGESRQERVFELFLRSHANFELSMWAQQLVLANNDRRNVCTKRVEMDGTSCRIRPGQDRYHTLDPAALLATFFMAPIHLLWDHDRGESTLQLHTLLPHTTTHTHTPPHLKQSHHSRLSSTPAALIVTAVQ